MAMGIPIVSTSKAANGTQATPDKHVLVADEPEAFSSEVTRLLRDAALCDQIAASARTQVENKHSWPVSMRMVDAILDTTTLPPQREKATNHQLSQSTPS
jgi:hypothetical protein